MSIPFSCGTSGSNNLCFNQGTCYVNNFQQYACNCTGNYQRDYSFFHNDNCVMPKDAYLIALIIASAIYFIALFALLYKVLIQPKQPDYYVNVKHPRTKAIIIEIALIYVLEFFHFLSLYLQNGNYEAAPVFLTLVIIVGAHWLFDVVEIFLAAKQRQEAVDYKTTKRRARFLSYLSIFLHCTAAISEIALCRGSSAQFNVAAMSYMVYSLFFTIALSLMGLMEVTRIRKAIQASNLFAERDPLLLAVDAKLGDLVVKLILFGLNMVFLLPWIITQGAIGSTPYIFVWFFFALMVLPLNMHWVSLSIITEYEKQQSQQTPYTPNDLLERVRIGNIPHNQAGGGGNLSEGHILEVNAVELSKQTSVQNSKSVEAYPMKNGTYQSSTTEQLVGT